MVKFHEIKSPTIVVALVLVSSLRVSEMKKPKNLIGFAILMGVVMVNSTANGGVIFDFAFDNNGPLDGAGVEGSQTVTLGAESVTLTIISLSVPQFNNGTLTGFNSTDATVNLTSSDGVFGINNLTVNNDDHDTATGANLNESSVINVGESVTFAFDEDVTFDVIDFNSLGGGETAIFDIDGVRTTFGATNSDDRFFDPFGAGFVIPADTNITLSGGGPDSLSFTLDEFTVSVAPVVPEPSTLAIFAGVLGLGFAPRRRR